MRIEIIDENGNTIYCEEDEMKRRNFWATIKHGLKTAGEIAVEVLPTAIETAATCIIVSAAVKYIRKN